MRIVVIGGAGYIGSHMCKMLAEFGHEVVVLDDLSTGHRAALRWGTHFHCSILNTEALRRAFAARHYDCVIHFASAIIVSESVADPLKYYACNVAGTLNLLAELQRAGIDKLVFSSSAAIFGEPRQVSIDESHAVAPINPYGHSKAMIEQVLRDCAQAYSMRAVALRYFNAAGADPSGVIGESHSPETHLIPRLLRAAAGEVLDFAIFGLDHNTADGTCIRDYVHVNDLCAAHVSAIDFLQSNPGFHAFNLGNGNGFSVLEVIRAVEQVTSITVPRKSAPRREGDPARLVACSDLARRVLGWRPSMPELTQIVETAWRWHRAPAY